MRTTRSWAPPARAAIPEFGTSFVRGMLEDTQPHRVRHPGPPVRLLPRHRRVAGQRQGPDHLQGTATVGQAIGCRDDIMLFLISKRHGPEKRSFKIMEAVRKGRGLPEGAEEEMKDARGARLVHRLLQEDRLPVPQGPRGGLCDDGLPHRLVQGPPAAGLLRRLLLHPGQRPSTRRCMCPGHGRVLKARCKEIVRQGQGRHRRGAGHAHHPGGVLRVLSPGLHLPSAWTSTSRTPSTFMHGQGDKAAAAALRVGGRAWARRRPWPWRSSGRARTFISVEEVSAACPKVSKTHIDKLTEAGAFGDMPATSQLDLFAMLG